MPEPLSSEQPLAVSIPEACRKLDLGETTLRILMDSGRLPFSRIPGANPQGRGRILIKVADLNALLDQTRVKVVPLPTARRTGRARR
jgi:Helix-turn-helix domain